MLLLNFLPLGHKDFRNLSFQDQLKIIGLYKFNKESYEKELSARGFSDYLAPLDEESEYIHAGLHELENLDARQLPHKTSSLPIEFTRHWAAYKCSYDVREYEKYDNYCWGIQHRWVINSQMFNFPIMIVDDMTKACFDWLAPRTKNSITGNLRSAIAMSIIADERGLDFKRLSCGSTRAHIYASLLSDKGLEFSSVSSINGVRPTIYDSTDISVSELVFSPPPPTKLLRIFETCVRVDKSVDVPQSFTIINAPRYYDTGIYYYPVVPTWFYCREPYFSINKWGFMI